MNTSSKNLKNKKGKKSKKKLRKKSNIRPVNLYILYSVLALVAIGVIMVFSASYYDSLYKHKNVFYFLKRQLLWMPIGIVVLVITTVIDYHYWRKFTYQLYIGTGLILLSVFFIGTNVNGATRWIRIGSFSFQPSELAKYAIVFFLAALIDKNKDIKKSWVMPIKYLMCAALFAGLVYKQNNLSIASVIMFVAFIIVFVSGMSFKQAGVIIVLGIGLILIGILGTEYRMDRFMSFMNPWKYADKEGYQLIHSLYALGSGGVWGVGLGNSKQKALYMPEPHNDFIFAIIGEEFGFFGCTVVISIFVILILAGIEVARTAKDVYGKLLAIGIISVITLQFLINIAVVTGSMPVTGVPLPFISYGGTALVFNLGAVGVLLNISRHCKTKKDEINEKIKNKINYKEENKL